MQTEQEMHASEAPIPATSEELITYIESLISREHDYGTCVYAMSLAATAALNHVASKLGVTGFQASCADLDIIRRTRGIKGPFWITKADDLLYPQYDLHANLEDYIRGCEPWLIDQAVELLKTTDEYVAPQVKEHWEKLAALRKS